MYRCLAIRIMKWYHQRIMSWRKTDKSWKRIWREKKRLTERTNWDVREEIWQSKDIRRAVGYPIRIGVEIYQRVKNHNKETF